MSGSTSKRYPAELRERAVRMVAEIRAEHESEWAAMGGVAELLGIGTLRQRIASLWVLPAAIFVS